MNHIVDVCQCPLTEYDGGLQSLNDDDDALNLLENTASTTLIP